MPLEYFPDLVIGGGGCFLIGVNLALDGSATTDVTLFIGSNNILFIFKLFSGLRTMLETLVKKV